MPFNLPFIEEDDIRGVVDSLRQSQLTGGPKTAEFERRFAALTGAKYAVAVNSCTAGLHCVLAAAGIGPGDEVLTTPLAFPAAVNAIVQGGARPVFADIEPLTLNLDPAGLENKITSRTKAILPAHLAGHPCDLDALLAVAGKYNLLVLEDAAAAVYARYKGKPVGAAGHAAVFSFAETQNLVTGEGGMVTTGSDLLAERVRAYSYTYTMTEMQAALGLTQLAKLGFMQTIRELIAERYHEAFGRLPALAIPVTGDYAQPAWNLYIIRLNLERIRVDRDRFLELLGQENIGTSLRLSLLHLQPYVSRTYGYQRGDFPRAESVFDRIVPLPLYPRMSEDDVQDVIDAVLRVTEAVMFRPKEKT